MARRENMIFKSVNIGGHNYFLSDFTQLCKKDSTILVKNSELSTLLRLKSKPIQIQFVEIKDSIFLLESFGNQPMIPSSLMKCSTIYYLYDDSCCNYHRSHNIVEYVSKDEFASFLERIDYKHAKWKVLSKSFLDDKIYVTVKSRSTNNKIVEYWFSDLYTSLWDVDNEWTDFLYNQVLKQWLEDYYNKK